jgi:zinc/manganese transport system ATP-binding protein
LSGASGAVADGVLGQSGDRIVVRLENLTVSYRQHPALHHISGEFAKGSLTAVIGPNGSGKSSLLKTIMGLLPASGGSVQLATGRAAVAYLPQQSELDRSFPMSVHECVLLGGWGSVGAWGSVDQALLARVSAAIKAVRLDGFEQRPVGSLSSGQFQRVLFARMLMQDARLILLDEPFAAMDSRTTAALLELIRQWHREGRTVVAVLHDDAQVLANFPQTLLLARELVAWGATADVLTSANLQRARALAEAWDDQAEICHTDEHVASP